MNDKKNRRELLKTTAITAAATFAAPAFVRGRKRKEGPSAFEEGSPISDLPHFRNWVAALRSRRRDDLSAEIEHGHMSSALCHLANIAYRVDRTVKFDPQAETFINDADADALLTRPAREGFAVPKEV